jgi:hypothetical protein
VIRRLVSGGQTGVDRAALDIAIELGIEHGGWCPRGRRAEDGPLDERYLLTETKSANYAVRTERNVIDSDATLILYRKPLSSGTRLTLRLAQKHERDYLLVEIGDDADGSADEVIRWINSISSIEAKTLNVAGPRESSRPTIYEHARAVLKKALDT